MDSDGEGSAGRRSAAQVAGVVIETLPSALYRVRLDEGRW